MNQTREITPEDEAVIQELLPQVVSRQEWGAKPSKKRRKFKTLIDKVILTTTDTSPCYSKNHCINNIREYQDQELGFGRNDIPYNFLIGNDGRIYEVMGFEYEADCNFSTWNPLDIGLREIYEDTLNVAFICMQDSKPGLQQIKAAASLLILGIQEQRLVEDLEISERNVTGPIFPKDGFQADFLDENEEQPPKKMSDDEALEFLNSMYEEDEEKMTKEQMLEELKDSERLFKEFDEKLKEQNMKLIRENYPWHFKKK